MKLKVCQVRDAESAADLVACGADFLGFHVLDESHVQERDAYAAINRKLVSDGYSGGVILTKAQSLDWIIDAAAEGAYAYVQTHRDLLLEDVAELGRRLHGQSCGLIQVVDPAERSPDYVAALLDLADFVLYDNYQGGTGMQLGDDILEALPMDRAFIAGGVDAARADEIRERYNPFGIDVQSWVKRSDGGKDLGRVRELLRITQRP